MAKLHANGKMNTSLITVFFPSGQTLLHAANSYGAIDFTITDASNVIASIEKCSPMYDTIKENLFSYNEYRVKNMVNDAEISLILLAMIFAIDLQFFL